MKRFFSAFLIILLAISAFPFCASASITITTPEQFLEIANNPSGNFILGSDISLENYSFTGSLFSEFSGTLNGNGYEIGNISITSQNSKTALIDTLTGEISNVLISGDITVSSDFGDGIAVAGITTTLNGGTLQNVYCAINITVLATDASIGGIAAISRNGASITNCINAGNISFQSSDYGSRTYVGGITAYIYDKSVTLDYCENLGNITAGNSYSGNIFTGGIFAFCSSQATFKGNLNRGLLTAISDTCAYAGGIAAIIANYTMLKESQNASEVTATHYAGGICAEVSGKDGGGSIYNCANLSKISSDSLAGGICANFNGRALFNNFCAPISAPLCPSLQSYSRYENNYSQLLSSYKGFDFNLVWSMGDNYPEIKNKGASTAPRPKPADVMNWSYDKNSGALTISGTGNMPDFGATTMPWYSLRNAIYSINIEEGITGIGDWAFSYCYYARMINLPESLKTVGDYAFYNCQSLEEVLLPESVTTLGNNVFSYCKDLQAVSVPKNITTISKYNFYDCKSLSTVYYAGSQSEWDAVNKTSFNDALTSATVKTNTVAGTTWHYENGTLTISGYGRTKNYTAKTTPWFEHTNDIKKIVVEEGVTGLGNYAFGYCYYVTDVSLPDSLLHIGSNVFYNCMSLEEIDIPSGVRRIFGAAFYNCKKLDNITIPAQVDTIYAHTFMGCTSLANVSFNGTKVQWQKINVLANNEALTNCDINYLVKSIEWNFDEETGTLTISGGIAMDDYELSKAPMAPWAEVKTKIKKVVIEDGIPNIGKNAFYGCYNLTEIQIPDSVTSIGYGAFMGTSLKSIDIPENVTYIGSSAFNGCALLTEVNIPAGVTNIYSYTFYNCKKLSKVTFDGNKANVNIVATGNEYFTALVG